MCLRASHKTQKCTWDTQRRNCWHYIESFVFEQIDPDFKVNALFTQEKYRKHSKAKDDGPFVSLTY